MIHEAKINLKLWVRFKNKNWSESGTQFYMRSFGENAPRYIYMRIVFTYYT